MKSKTFKRIFSGLLSLIFIFNISTLGGYADNGSVAIGDTNLSFDVKISNTGLKKGDEVKVAVYGKLSGADGTVGVVGATVQFDYNDWLEYKNFEIGDMLPNEAVSDYGGTFQLMIDNGLNNIILNTNKEYLLGTVVFKLKEAKTEVDSVVINISKDGSETNFNDEKANALGAEASGKFDFSANLTACASHTFGSWEEVKSANCTTPGEEKRTCTNCGHEETRAIPAGHKLTHHEAVAATCKNKGKKEYWECSACGKKFSDDKGTTEVTDKDLEVPVDSTNHTGKKEVRSKADATCAKYGYTGDTYCLDCGAKIATGKTIPKTEHEYEWKVTKEATCTEDGVKTGTCKHCGDTKTETIPATGHHYGDWKVVREATCTQAGIKARFCDICNEQDPVTQTMPALGHHVVYTDNGDGTCTGKCTNTGCTLVDGPKEHEYTDEVVAPTETRLGGTKHTCIRCGSQYWDNFTKDDTYAQTEMPSGETIYHYATKNGLSVEKEVEIGDGLTIKVFLQDPLRVLKKNDTDVLDLVVSYVPEGSAYYNELLANLDDTHEVEHIKFFNVYPTVNGKVISGQLDNAVYMEYQVPEGWDENDLQMVLVQMGSDQEFEEKVLDIDGTRYMAIWANHFSPYAYIDTLSADEVVSAGNTASAVNTASTETSNSETPAPASPSKETSKGKNTGDYSGVEMLFVIVLASGIFITVYYRKRKNSSKEL